MACVLGFGLGAASASIVTVGSGAVSITVPDGNAAGITSTIHVNVSSWADSMNSLSLTLNITGGNEGDLYAYLSYGGTSVVLLKRPGLAGDPAGIGYTGTLGENYTLTLSDGNYPNINYTSPTSGGLSGTYNPSAGSVAFTSYNGMNPNGNWVLFVSDLSGGDNANVSVLNSWSLTFNAVPEPVNVALGVFAVALLAGAGLRRARGYFKVSSNIKTS